MQTLRKFDSSFGVMLEDGAKIMLQIFSGLVLIVILMYQLAVIKYPYSMDYGEAPLVDHAMQMVNGQNIYRPDLSTPPYTISNYPPLYIVLLAISVKLFGPSATFTVGRIISALCGWIAALSIGLIIHRLTRDRFATISGVAIFLAFPFVVYWSPLLRIDMLALALSLAGLCLLVSESLSTRDFISASILIVAAIYTRQSYVLAAPFAGFVWLLFRDWRKALQLALVVGGLSLVLFLIFNVMTNGGFYYNIVTANVNQFKMTNLKDNWNNLRHAALIPLIFGAVSLFVYWRVNPLWKLAAPYLIGATLSAITIGKIGANVNYLLELCAALGLAGGAVIAWSRSHLSIYSLRGMILIMLTLGVGWMLRYTLQNQTYDLHEHLAQQRDLSELASLVSQTDGKILADEHMDLITMQGRPLTIQPFEVTQLAWAGKWDQTPLLNSIAKHEYTAIIIYDKPWAKERWTQEMFDTINKSYVLSAVVAGNKVYTPPQEKTTQNLHACPGAAWQLPGDATLGVQWQDSSLVFFGQGREGAVPVYAVADGLLTRQADWVDAVAIQHDDPLHPSTKLWSFYSGMSVANGTDSLIVKDFAPGVENVPVKAGQLLGYEGTWSGRPQWPMWIHVQLQLVKAAETRQFPTQLSPESILDPSPYLKLAEKAPIDMPYTQPLSCSSK
jgi:hypothetical protein